MKTIGDIKMEDDNDIKKDKNDKKDSWPISIPFNITSEFCPFNGNKMVQTFFYCSELAKNNCLHPMNKNWTMWSLPECKKDGCPIKTGD